MAELLYKDEVYAIVGAAIEVHNPLGTGFLEAVYHEALEIEERERGIPYESHKRIKIACKGQVLLKDYEADQICLEKIVVEIKAIDRLTTREDAHLLNYLKATGYRVGVRQWRSPRMEAPRSMICPFTFVSIRVYSWIHHESL